MEKTGVNNPSNQDANEGIGRIVPYKNPCALMAYYFGVFSAIPCLGVFMGIPAVLLGVRGMMYCKNNEHAKGKVHAWIGIVSGSVFTLVWTGLAIVWIFRVLIESQ